MSQYVAQRWTRRILLGLCLGLALGLVVGWGIWPFWHRDAAPTALPPDQKATYIALTALAYGADGDLAHARSRLDALQDEDLLARIADLAGEYIRRGDDPHATYGLALLARDLGAASPLILEYLASAPTPAIPGERTR